MKTTKWIVGGLFVLVPAVLLAVNVGTYQCNSCTFGSPISGEDENEFIRTVVNIDVDTWVDSQGNPKSVTLCNATSCADYTYIKLSGLWKLDRKYPGGGSSGGGDSGGGDSGGSYYPPGEGGGTTCFSHLPCDGSGIG